MLTEKRPGTVSRLNAPIRSKYFERLGDRHVKASLCALQGYRPTMEENHVMNLGLSRHPNYYLFGIFDGHKGKAAADYLAENLPDELNKLERLDDPKLIQQCIMDMDKKFCSTSTSSDEGSTMVFALVKVPKATSGTTGTDRIHYDVTVYWLGDSRCLWISEDKITQITKDHVPTNVKEKERIEEASGTVKGGRVDSRLAMSRAFGDCSFKRDTSKPADQQKIVAKCDYHGPFQANVGDWLFLFSDGVVETVNNEELVKSLKREEKAHSDPAYALGHLFDELLDKGTKDNLCACLVQLQNGLDHGIGLTYRTFLPGPLYRWREDDEFLRSYMDFANLFGYFDTPDLRMAAYNEDIRQLRRLGLTDSSTLSTINEIEKVIDDLKRDLLSTTDTIRSSITEPRTGAITSTDDTTGTSTVTTADRSNKRRRVTLDQCVYVYERTI